MCAPTPIPANRNDSPEPHARQPQHKRRRGGEEQQEGYVVEISVPDGSGEELMSNFFRSSPATMSKSGA